MDVKELVDKETAEKVILFLQSEDAFELEMNDFRIKARHDAVMGSLSSIHNRYWYVENNGIIMGAAGVKENERKNGGYYLDYFAVHKKFRRKGFGCILLNKAEE